jgi:hypothetical protein
MTSRKARRMSRDVLAGALIRGSRFEEAACSGKWSLWGIGERLLQRRGAGASSAPEVIEMFLLCRSCPVVDACRDFARTDGYTGFAAGTTWDEGRPDVVAPEVRQRGGSGEMRAC